MKYLNFRPLIAANSSVATTNSDTIDLSQIHRLSVQANTGVGVITASIQLQVSNDEIKVGYFMQETPTHWVNLGAPLALAAASTNYLIPSQEVCYRSLRVVLTGTGANVAPVTVQIMAFAI